jgi:hypothetical protein
LVEIEPRPVRGLLGRTENQGEVLSVEADLEDFFGTIGKREAIFDV